MYIWFGIDVDGQLAQIRRQAMRAEEQIGFANRHFTFPLHVSLKISFPFDDEKARELIGAVLKIYEETEPFSVGIKGLEEHGNILWIRLKECRELSALHDRVYKTIEKRFGVAPHEYDLDYLFHVTLFMDDDREKIACARELLKGAPLPEKLYLSSFCAGASPDGSFGGYRITDRIEKGTPPRAARMEL